MAQIEPMDIDTIGSEFDNKENSLHISNVLPRTPCTEKGYEELDVSELNMKLRYSITPASSPMSRSYTANCKDNKTFNLDEDSLNSTIINDNSNLTRSLNSTITKCDILKSPKLPLQALPTDQFNDNMSSVQRSLDNDPNITITVNGTYNIDDNLSLPSTSSSTVQTPEATTPTKDIPKDGGSPIMRGLKSVLNMFRSSQSPIPPEDSTPSKDISEPQQDEQKSVLASTPISNKNKDNNSPKRTSPLKDSVVFKDDLERELQWKDDSTIIFKQEKIPIHKLFLQQSTSLAVEKKIQSGTDNLNSTVEYMDVSYNDSVIADKTMTDVECKTRTNVELTSGVESDGEFLDCETYSKHEQISEQQVNITHTAKVNEFKHVGRDETDKETHDQFDNSIITENDPHPPILIKNDEQYAHLEEATDKTLNEDQANTEVASKKDHTFNFDRDIKTSEDVINLVNHMNVTVNLNAPDGTCNKSDNFNELTKALLENNDTDKNETNILENAQEEKSLPNTLPIIVNKDTEVEEKELNVTMPLNVETHYTDDSINENKDNNDLNSIQKDNNLHQELGSQNLNTGILQICTNESENYKDSTCNNGHTHANNAPEITDVPCITLEIENKVVENVISNEIVKELINAVDDKYTQNAENSIVIGASGIDNTISIVTNYDAKDKLIDHVEAENIENIINHDVRNFDNELAVKDNSASDLNLIKDINNEITNIDSKIVKTVDNVEHILDTFNLQDFPPIDLAADVPLPSDEEIEKDSLTDLTPCVIRDNEIAEEDIETLAFVTKNKTVNLLEAMDVPCEVITNTNVFEKNQAAFANEASYIDKIPVEENITSSLTLQKDMLNSDNKSLEKLSLICNTDAETLKESVTISNDENDAIKESANLIPENKLVLPDILAVTKQETQHTNETQHFFTDPTEVKEMDIDISHIENLDEKNIRPNEKNLNNLNEVEEFKGNKANEDEIITSANSSPFVSVNELNIPKTDIELDQIESPFETKPKIAMSPPISPKLPRRGYNINFDEIDDPFATKTNIRMSPTPETSPKSLNETVNLCEKKPDIQKKTQQNRRKSQLERQKRDVMKKKFNSSYSFGTKPRNNDEIKGPVEEAIKLNKEIDQTNVNSTMTLSKIENENLTTDLDVKIKSEENYLNESNKLEFNSKTEDAVTIEKEEELPITMNITTNEKECLVKSVFNLPEIDDKNFNPFVTKTKIRKTPSPTFESKIVNEVGIPYIRSNESTNNQQEENLTANIDNNIHHDKVETSNISSETCSSKNTDKVREINTEDEDTVEGPFLEAEDFEDVDQVGNFGTENDMMQFEDLPTGIDNGNKEEGELFIDAEAFEFLLNQNKSNVVADSGKESLFLKFDPLFAKRVSSDGVFAALNRIQKRQSTPKKTPTPAPRNVIDEEKPTTSSLTARTAPEESNDETNATLTKPMMVVNPAINPLVSPRKSTTPPRINRRSLTFTSPAIAVIDRLLSLSGNSSTLDHETTMPRQHREYNETDIALTQLRELLAEKEIHVHNLRSESKELKERLATMESQVKSLEKESEERLKKVTELNERLTEKTKINKSMAVVVEEYERTIASLIAEMEQEKRRNAEERATLISERDEQTAHLSSMEVSFSDLHSKYEKSKQIILSMKANEDTYKKSIKEFEDNLLKMQNNYELLKQHATSKLNHANQELEKFNRAHESEVLKLNAMIKRKELHITSLEESLAQKTKANEELTAICDELINKVG